jgi:pSer/pThr/pTyr-binding forkhead associated (FHA) protein
MMDVFNLNSLLFAGKWVFIGLIYLILMLVVIAVRREMTSRTISRQPVLAFAPGHLYVIDPGGDKRISSGTSLPLKSTTSLGAYSENDIVLGDPYVSGRHARLTWDGSAWWIEDLGSSNGTHVDGTHCPPHVPRQAVSGARLSLGDMVFELRS